MKTGKVHLVGAGPGAPDLLTVRAARLLECADVVFHDALVHPDVLGLCLRARKITVGKRCGAHSTAQRFINKRLIDAARRHSIVVRLKGGDPMLFGRAQEEIDALQQAGIEVEIVPGVTAALAASAALKVSLTCRGISRNVAFVTPRVGQRQKAGDWMASAAAADTAVVYMGAREAGMLQRELISRGLAPDTPVALVEDASLASERCHAGTLSELEALASRLGSGPAIVVLGEVLRGLAAARLKEAGKETSLRKAS